LTTMKQTFSGDIESVGATIVEVLFFMFPP
jgi:hypothetical protein